MKKNRKNRVSLVLAIVMVFTVASCVVLSGCKSSSEINNGMDLWELGLDLNEFTPSPLEEDTPTFYPRELSKECAAYKIIIDRNKTGDLVKYLSGFASSLNPTPYNGESEDEEYHLQDQILAEGFENSNLAREMRQGPATIAFYDYVALKDDPDFSVCDVFLFLQVDDSEDGNPALYVFTKKVDARTSLNSSD